MTTKREYNMPKFIEIYKRALQKYINQEERSHYSHAQEPNRRIFTFGFFSKLRHSQYEYPALIQLRQELEKDTTDEQIKSSQAIQRHFNNKANKWNNHSFNCYLLDELNLSVPDEQWESIWKHYDPAPIHYYRGILFRGTGDNPITVFKDGLHENNNSISLQDYVKDMNGAIGVSTSKNFFIAQSYALPTINIRNEFQEIWNESYIYVLDYQGSCGIDLEQTFRARGKSFSAYLSSEKDGKAEVNVIGQIETKYIVGAFYVNRENTCRWLSNPNYPKEKLENQMDCLRKNLPDRFKAELPQVAHLAPR